MKPQRPSLDTSFGSPSVQRAPQTLLNANRTRANSATSQSSSAFATPPEGSSPRQSQVQSGDGANSNPQAVPKSSNTTNATTSYTSTHNRTASVGSPPLFEFVKAKYDYTPDHPSGLPFYAGQIIRVHYKDQSGWWDGECGSVRGWFPSNYLLENSSRFVRATPQASRRNVAKRSRNASIDVVTSADLQNVQNRSISSLTGRTPTTSNSTSEVTTPTQPPYSDRRRPSLATTNELDEHITEVDQRQIEAADSHPASTGTGRPSISRSTSSQNVSDYSLMSSRAQTHSYSQSQSHSRYPSHSAASTHGGYQDSAPNPQQSQQDWANLSMDDLIALQKYLSHPSPLSARRHPDPSLPFEPDVIRLLQQQDSSITDERIGEEMAQVQYLNVTHRALWVIENAAIATTLVTSTSMESSGSSGSGTHGQAGTVSVELSWSISNSSSEGALAARDHLAPAMACVIGTVRSVLSSSGCLARESINLHSFPVLLGHRKVVLGELARLVSQTKRVGSRDDEFADPLSPVVDDSGRRGSQITGGRNSSSDLGLDVDFDVEIKRELERSQAVYDAVRRFILAAIECRIRVEQPPFGVRGLFGLEEEEREGYSGESDGLTGEGSWEEDHGFRFHVASNSLNNNSGSADDSGPSTSEHTSSLALVRSSKYAIRARRFTNGRPGHLRARAGSHGSGASGYASGSGSAGSRNSGGSTTAVSKGTPLESIQQRIEYGRPHAATIVGRGEAGADSRAASGAEPRAASAVAAAAAMRAAKSLGDLRAKYRRNGAGANGVPPMVSEDATLNPSVKAARRGKVIHGRPTKPNAAAAVSPLREHGDEPLPRANKSSISSISSADSSSAQSSSPTNSSPPGSPGFPSGPCTLAQVLQALRATQDRILHGTAAFIGAAQYHSRSSHPASKGYLVSLTREIVDFVRRLLMIADAIISHPTVRVTRAREVEMAGVYKARLYVEMNKVVNAVRGLTAIRNDDSDVASSVEQEDGDDEGKRIVLKSAHLTNKCAADLVLALKLSLSLRSSGAASDSQEGQTSELLIVIPEDAAKLSQPEYEHSSATESYSLSSPSDRDISISSTPITSPVQVDDKTPKPAVQHDQSDKEDAGSTTTRARSQTTRDNRRYSINSLGLHKKAASMVGMNAAYRSPGIRDLHQISEREEPINMRGLQKLSSKTSEEIAAYMDAEAERTAELNQEHHPLLMSEQEFSDVQEDLEHEEVAENPDLDFDESRMILADDTMVIPPKAIRRSVDQNQVRLSLERGLLKRPSLDLEEPTTPLDGTEEVIDLDDEKEEIDHDIPPPTPAKELPPAPASIQPVPSSRPVSALPPKPANTDGFIVSHNGDIVLNSDGVVVGATLAALVERITPSDVFGDQKLTSYFLLTFRLFTTPSELVDAIINRFKNPITFAPAADAAPMSSSTSLAELPRGQTADIVHIRLINFIKEWIQRHWYPVRDAEALPKLIAFFRELAGGLYPNVVGSAKRLLSELEKMAQKMDTPSSGPSFDSVRARMDRARSAVRLRDQTQAMPLSALSNPLTPTTPISASSPAEIPRPELAKSLLNQLRTRQYLNISILEFSPVEMARQLTLFESRLYQDLPPEEVLETGKGSKNTPHINEIVNLSTSITGWVTDLVLKEGLDIKKRIAYIKFFLKVGKECLALNNYSTPRSMMAALESTPISRLRSVWAGVSQKHMVVFNEMRHLCEHTRNSAYYRERLRSTPPPAVPFLGLVLTDVTFTREGNGALRPCPTNPGKMLINFNRYNRLAKILGDMIRLQQPYSLKELPEVQQYLAFTLDATRFTRDADLLHRQSLLIEPKADDDSKKGTDLFGWNFGSVRGNPP